MPLFMIKRISPDATAEDIDAAVFRAVSCVYEFDGLKWVTSYWDRDGGITYCIYDADSIEQIQQHSQRAQIACDEVWPVTSIDPSRYISSPDPARLESA